MNMKVRLLLAGLILLSFCFTAKGQQNEIEAPGQEAVLTDSSRIDWKGLIRDIQGIKEIQDCTYRQRMRAIDARKAAEKESHGETSEFGVMSEVERNTRFDFLKNGWNLIAALALLVAIWTLIVTKRTYRAQKQTEQHTQKAPFIIQIGIFKDLPRHFYRNLVCSAAAILKYMDVARNGAGKNKRAYPSESNIGKLTTLPEEFILPVDAVNNDLYREMHEAQLLFRNYNIEVDTAAKHLARVETDDQALSHDFDNLLFKPLHLTGSIYGIQDKLYEAEAKDEEERNRWKVKHLVRKLFGKKNPGENSVKGEWNVPYTVFSIVHAHLSKFSSPTALRLDLLPAGFTLEFFSDSGDFDRKKFDALFGPATRDENGILRSVGDLLKKVSIGKDPYSFLCRKRKEDGSLEDAISIDVKEFRRYFANNYNKSNPNLPGRLDRCFNVSDDIESFKAAYGLQNVPEETVAKQFEILKPYYAFFYGKDMLDVKQLIFLMTMVDAALELPNIGMVNYN